MHYISTLKKISIELIAQNFHYGLVYSDCYLKYLCVFKDNRCTMYFVNRFRSSDALYIMIKKCHLRVLESLR